MDLQDTDGWRLVSAVWDGGSAAGGVVGDLAGECGRHVGVVAFVVFVTGVSDMKLSRTDESCCNDGPLKNDARISLE